MGTASDRTYAAIIRGEAVKISHNDNCPCCKDCRALVVKIEDAWHKVVLERADALARVAELENAAIRNDERHADKVASVRARAEHAEARVRELEGVCKSAHDAWTSGEPEDMSLAMNALEHVLAFGSATAFRVHRFR